MRYLLPILLLFSCVKTSTDVLSKPQALSVTDGLPNIYIPKNETGWKDFERFGIGSFYLRVANTPAGRRLTYNCPLAATGADFTVCMSCNGIPDSTVYGGYRYKGMLRIRLYRAGLKEYEIHKDVYQLQNTNEKEWYVYTHGYGADTMWISNGAADNYYNSVYLTGDGVQHVLVDWNYERLYQESKYDDNSQFFGFNVIGLIVTLDTSPPVKPIPVSNIIAIYDGRGQVKKVNLSFNGHGEKVYILRNGVHLGIADSTFTDSNLPKGWRTITYSFQKIIEGFGVSNPVTKTVTK